ncbi:MAG TPA: chemotaxis protein CheD [Gemmatimonadales bacterium]|nr:chemotaxis protein CheD [Gemmatimonadales bacterium]
MDREIVKVAEIRTGQGSGRLVALGLGSCVAIILWDPATKIGGMAHVLLPAPPPRHLDVPAGRYAQTAVPELLRRMLQAGADRSAIVARLVGGAAMFANLLAPGLIHSGERNVLASRHALHAAGLPLQREWVGEDFGRSVELDLATGRVVASSVRHGARDL